MNGSNFLFVVQINPREDGILIFPRAMRTSTPEDRCAKYNDWCATNCESKARVILWGTVCNFAPYQECYYHASFDDVTDAQLFRMTFPEVRG